ncbi:MAG: TonB-dependent receptor [Deltaproteobacteria bacterium]|nr:TonB-dependent receptor [Deltaproteobacteria bacterium]MBW2074765.1 TonB-dependent receptor [Deltaproteobacteria bacterium]
MTRNGFVRFSWICFVAFCFMVETSIFFPLWARAEEKEPVFMEEIVVSATKTREKRRDIPNAIILKDDFDIQASSAKSLGELLANEPGIDWRTYGNYGGASEEIRIRGMAGKGTQVLINGMTINSPSLGTANVGRIPLNNIERIEVVKGSGSVLYGSGAVGGVVNIVTKRPERDKIDAKVTAGYGSQETYQVSVEHGMFAFGDFGYYLTANRRGTDGFRDNSDLTHQDVSLNLVLEKGDDLDISLYGDYITRDYGVPGLKPPPGTGDYYRNGVKFYSSEAASLLNKGSDDDGHVVLNVKSRLTDWVAVCLKSDYTHMVNYYYQRYNSNGTGAKTWVTNEVIGNWGDVEIKPFEGATLLMGAEYRDYEWVRENVDLNADGSEAAARTARGHSLNTTGTFAEVQYRPCKYFKALAGFRNEKHSAFGTENLPQYGIVLNPLDTTTLKLSHGRHFFAPTPNDLFWPQTMWMKGNEDLKPETGWHTDATLEQSLFDNKLFLTTSYFKWDMSNRIQWRSDPVTWVYSPVNLKSYKADGFELGTKIGPVDDFSLCLGYTYLDAEEEAEEYGRESATAQKTWTTRRAIYSPEHQFKGSLIYENSSDLSASVTARYMSDRLWYRDESQGGGKSKTVVYTLDPYWTVDLKVGQRLFHHWVLSGQVNNLFDKHYDTYMGTFYDEASPYPAAGYPGAGRSVFFGVMYEY